MDNSIEISYPIMSKSQLIDHIHRVYYHRAFNALNITRITPEREEDWREFVEKRVNAKNIDRKFGERYSGTEETLKKKLTKGIRARIDELVARNMTDDEIVERVSREFHEYAEYVLEHPIKIEAFRNFVGKLLKEELEKESREGETGREAKKRRFGGKGRFFIQTPTGRVKGGGRKGREVVEITRERDESYLLYEEQTAMADPPQRGKGKIFIIVENPTNRDAFGIEVSCGGVSVGHAAGASYNGTVRRGKTRTFVQVVDFDVPNTVTCSSSSHEVEPDAKNVTVKPRRGGVGSGTVSFKLVKTEKDKRSAGKLARGKISGIVKGKKDYQKRALSSIFMLIAGFMVSAILGIVWFIFAFLAFAAHLLIPPETGENVREKIESIRDSYERRISEAEKSKRDKEEIDRLYGRMKTAIEIEAVVGKLSFRGVFGARMHKTYYGRGFLKEFFKALGFLFLMIGFVWSPIPLAPVIGIIVGFAGYFMLGGSDYYKKSSEEKEK